MSEENKTPIQNKRSAGNVGISPTKNVSSRPNMSMNAPIKKPVNVKQKTDQKPLNISKNNSIIKPTKDTNTNKDIVAEQNQEERKKKRRKIIIWLIIICLLLKFLVAGVILLSRDRDSNLNFSIDLSNTQIKTEIEDENGNIEKIICMPGDTIDAKILIEIINENGTPVNYERVFLRFKIEVFVDDNYYAQLFDPILSRESDWIVGDDGYIYYNYLCYGNEKIEVCKYLNFIENSGNNVLNGKSGNLVITAEILEGNYGSISQMWNTSPDEWRTTVR